jgi:hypothetical protein
MSADAPQYGHVLGAQVRDKIARHGTDLPTLEAVAFLRAVGIEPTAERVLAVKLGMELGCLMSTMVDQRARALALAPVAGGVQ